MPQMPSAMIINLTFTIFLWFNNNNNNHLYLPHINMLDSAEQQSSKNSNQGRSGIDQTLVYIIYM